MAGWQKIYRDIQEHWLWEDKPFSRGQAWIDLILIVNHEDNKALIDGELIEVKRGSKITSIRKLSELWGWSTTKVKKFLEQLEKDKMIIYKSDSKKTLVSIENYSIYQSKETTEVTEKKHRNNTEVTQKNFGKISEVKQKNTNKNDKEYIKNDKEGEERKEDTTQLISFPTQTHELIFNQFGEVTYKTWFANSNIEIQDNLILINVDSDFKKQAIQKYTEVIATITNKNVSVKNTELEELG